MYFSSYSKTQDYEMCTFEGTSVAIFKLWYILLKYDIFYWVKYFFITDLFLFFIIPFGINKQ